MANGFGQSGFPTDEWLNEWLRKKARERNLGGHYNVDARPPVGTVGDPGVRRSSIPTVATGAMQPNIGGGTQDFISDAIPVLESVWEGAKRRASDPLYYLPLDLQRAISGFGSGQAEEPVDPAIAGYQGGAQWSGEPNFDEDQSNAGAIDMMRGFGQTIGNWWRGLGDSDVTVESEGPATEVAVSQERVTPIDMSTLPQPRLTEIDTSGFPQQRGATGEPAKSWQERLFGFGGGDPNINMMMTGLRMLGNASKGQGFGQSLADAYIGQTADARQLEAQSYARNFAKQQLEKSERWEDRYAKELIDIENKMAQITDKNDPSYARLMQRKQYIEGLLVPRYASGGSLLGGGYFGGGATRVPQGVDAQLDALSQILPR